MYGIFGVDDTFCFAESCGHFFNTSYYLNNVITNSKITPFFNRKSLPWKSSGIIDVFGVKSFVVSHYKFINKELDDIEDEYLFEANNVVNDYLKNNTGFVEKVFDETIIYKKNKK